MSNPTQPSTLPSDTPCFVVARGPQKRWGPYRLRTAVLNIVTERPPGEVIEIHVADAPPLAEDDIRTLYTRLKG